MLVKNISFLIPLTDIEDIYDDNIDVGIELEDGSEYTVMIGTLKNLFKNSNILSFTFMPILSTEFNCVKLRAKIQILLFCLLNQPRVEPL